MTTDNDIREMHGVSCQTPENKRSSFAVAEGETHIIVLATTDNPSRHLTLVQARYIADRIYELCHRIESRKAASDVSAKPKSPLAPKQEKQP